MNKAIGNQVLLTSDQVRGWQEDLQRWEARKTEADEHIDELKRKLDAAKLLSGLTFAPLESSTQVETEPGSMGETTKQILAEFDRPARHRELRESLRKYPKFRESLDKNPAYYYTMIARLVNNPNSGVRRIGRKIRLTHKNEAPTEGNPEGAP